MYRTVSIGFVLFLSVSAARGQGLLVPADKSLPPLAMVRHKVRIIIEDQVAVTRIEQTFRNPTRRPLEATYVFPVPRGASVNRFTMWVDGKETTGELLEAGKAREIYTGIVRRTQDPALLEYIGNDLLRLRVFPVTAGSDQTVSLQFTGVLPGEGGVAEFLYPLKTDGRGTAALEEFSIEGSIRSQHGVSNVFSPTHAIAIKRTSDHQVTFSFDRDQGLLDKDFQLFYSTSNKDIGLTALMHRPVAAEDGYFTFLISPKFESITKVHVPRDMVLVLDTSGSMRGPKMDQARRALKVCLDNLARDDRFALMNFSTTVNHYRDSLSEVSSDRVTDAKKWVEALEATGGTAIDAALTAALALRTSDTNRVFTVVFFTDGQPTIGETNPEKILQNVVAKNSASVRIFTFGVGDDVNATLLDQLADRTRAVSTYVRPAEDIEAKVSSLYAKISNPVLTNVKLTVSGDTSLRDIYPPVLPDLFEGTQLVVLGRYRSHGPVAIRLTGQIGVAGTSAPVTKELVYESRFSESTSGDRVFVEHLWARRKVGFLLDQIRANGQSKELVDEVVILAKRYGIATPYTSYLIVPDGPVPFPGPGRPAVGFRGRAGAGGADGAVKGLLAPGTATEFARSVNDKQGDMTAKRAEYADQTLALAAAAPSNGKDGKARQVVEEARGRKEAYDRARDALAGRNQDAVRAGKLGVDLSVQTRRLREQSRLEQTAQRNVLGRNILEIQGVWIDDGFDAKMPTLAVKAQSDAYFRILERHPKLKDLYVLGNRFVWVAPNGTALIVDIGDGKESLSDAEIDRLFVSH
jgi:Ca-activated chloride channel homolog